MALEDNPERPTLAEPEVAKQKSVEERLQALEESLKTPPKDIWDRLNTVSGIISGMIVAVIGFYATYIYDKHSKDAEQRDRDRNVTAIELQTVEKFFPHLMSSHEAEKQAAIQVISSLANSQLAAKIAQSFGGAGARAALTNISATSSQPQPSVGYALTDLFKDFGKSVCVVNVNYKRDDGSPGEDQGTCVIVSQQGYALTAAHLFADQMREFSVTLRVGSRDVVKRSAEIIKIDNDVGVALIKLNGADSAAVKVSAEQLQIGAAVTVLGFPAQQSLTVSTGIITSTSGERGRIALSAYLGFGSSGSPIFNSKGEVIGIIIGGMVNGTSSIAVPIQFTRPLLAVAGIS